MILAGDVGGTKVLLQLSTAGSQGGPDGGVLFERKYPSAGFSGLADVVKAFLAERAAAGGPQGRIQRACLAIAGPVSGQRVKVTNLPWEIDGRALAVGLDIADVKLVNDFEAAASGIDALDQDRLVTLQAGQPDTWGHRVVLGAGTGMGVAYAVWTGRGRCVVAGEGGHMGFAPADAVQAEFCAGIREREGRVTVEHVVSGPGLARLHDFFRRREAPSEASAASSSSLSPEAVIAAARDGGDPAARLALEFFVAAYGAVAGDHALAVLARGGVYIAGGVAPAILPELVAGGFLSSFRAKGAHSDLMRGIPVHVITDDRLCLQGARTLAGQP